MVACFISLSFFPVLIDTLAEACQKARQLNWEFDDCPRQNEKCSSTGSSVKRQFPKVQGENVSSFVNVISTPDKHADCKFRTVCGAQKELPRGKLSVRSMSWDSIWNTSRHRNPDKPNSQRVSRGTSRWRSGAKFSPTSVNIEMNIFRQEGFANHSNKKQPKVCTKASSKK